MKLRWWGVLLLVTLTGCGGEGPPRVRYGREECGYCRMIVNDDRFAAATITSSGESIKFDDVVCLVKYLSANSDNAGRCWIRGYQSGQWHDTTTAYFVYGPKLQTPMGSGLAAVGDQKTAEKLAADWGGRTLRFSELAAYFVEKEQTRDD